jgi:hypothetical protein
MLIISLQCIHATFHVLPFTMPWPPAHLTEPNVAAKFCNEIQKKLSRTIRQYSDDKKMNMRPIDPRSVMGDVIHIHDFREAAEE